MRIIGPHLAQRQADGHGRTPAPCPRRAPTRACGIERHLPERIEALDLGVEALAQRLGEALDRDAPPLSTMRSM